MDIVHSEEEAKRKIMDIMKEYPGATHYCYAYIIDNVKRFQDDGEPGGTAGMPILHVLESQNLQHIIAIVIRYFGGIKLGAGGLVRAYSNSVSDALKLIETTELIECEILTIEFEYTNTKQIDYLLQDYSITNKTFGEKITYEIASPKENTNDLLQMLSNHIDNYHIEKNTILISKQKEG